jgi:hypothetical protein
MFPSYQKNIPLAHVHVRLPWTFAIISKFFLSCAYHITLRETSANKSKLPNHSQNLNTNSQIRMKKYIKKRIRKPGEEDVELPRRRVLAAAAAYPRHPHYPPLLSLSGCFRCLSPKYKVRKCASAVLALYSHAIDQHYYYSNQSSWLVIGELHGSWSGPWVSRASQLHALQRGEITR